ncbi:uncharacterized protein LOC142333542 [Lycorma delicatula]|uniref:uncharacterized protein LOC142333542 n=1 Tax=Lycorma delicatula TaxID=130591 RepID=UPI003F5168F6
MYRNSISTLKTSHTNFMSINKQIVFNGILMLFITLCLIQSTEEAVVLTRRLQRAVSTESTTNNNSKEVKPPCHGRTPCGWAVYKPFTRRFDYYMENTCECPTGKVCLRTDDDLSVSAYVYTCRAESSAEKNDEGSPST